MKNKRMKIEISDFYCTCCGKKGICIPRKKGNAREKGHLKKMYCLYCQKEVNFAEVAPNSSYNYEMFKQEFEMGRFVDGIRIPIKELKFCDKECKYNIDDRCWNCKIECSEGLMNNE